MINKGALCSARAARRLPHRGLGCRLTHRCHCTPTPASTSTPALNVSKADASSPAEVVLLECGVQPSQLAAVLDAASVYNRTPPAERALLSITANDPIVDDQTATPWPTPPWASPLLRDGWAANLRSSVAFLHTLGMSTSDVGALLVAWPAILILPYASLRGATEFFLNLGLNQEDNLKLFRTAPRLLGFSVDEQLKPAVECARCSYTSLLLKSRLTRYCRSLRLWLVESWRSWPFACPTPAGSCGD